jgi:putative SOS response-associated peptidase YedK
MDERRSFSILTTSANKFMREIHDGMPVVLDRNDEDSWLDPEVHEQYELKQLLKPCPSEWLTAVEISSLVNSPKNNAPDVLEPAVTSRVAIRR